jgi:hypothetical protein
MGRAIVNRTFRIEGWVCQDGYCVRLVKVWNTDAFMSAETIDKYEELYRMEAEELKANLNFKELYDTIITDADPRYQVIKEENIKIW